MKKKKVTAKKKAVKKTVAKTGKKTAKKIGKKTAKKAPVKKSTAKKVSPKKTPAKKASAKKVVVKKTVAKKTTAKKKIVKKVVVKKTVVKPAKPAVKKAPVKKVIAKKTAIKKAITKTPVAEKILVSPPLTKASIERIPVPDEPAKKAVVREKFVMKDGGEDAKLVQSVIFGIQEKKGRNIVMIDLSDMQNAVCKYFVVCDGDSNIQINAIIDSIEDEVKIQTGTRPYRIEGKQNGQWILIDYVTVVVHVFLPEVRAFYNLESLWADGKVRVIKEDELAEKI